MEYQKILADLKNRKFGTIYFLEGEEPYYIDTISDYILEHVLDEAEKSFNQTLLYGKDISLDALLTAARRYPMMAERQVVVVREAQNLKDIEGLTSYIENPAPSTILVICHKYKNIDKRKKLYKAVQSNGIYLDSKPLYESQVPGWIVDYLKSLNLGIEPKAVQMITDYVGNNLQRIVNELDKVTFQAVPGTSITVDDVEKNIGISKEYNVFEFQKALGNRDIFKTNKIVNYMIDNEKTNPLPMITGILVSFFRKILTYHAAGGKGNDREMAQRLGISPFFINDYNTAARHYHLQKAVVAISIIREYDMRSKGARGGTADNGELLRELTYKLLHL